MNNPQFESQFSDLAFTYLRQKAPKLLDHTKGFQVIDKNEDETKAAGVFFFEVGSQKFQAPVFFLNGELKGHELLYIVDQDSLVPLEENWVNYLVNRRPAVLGGGTPYTEGELGISRPDFEVFSRSPLSFSKTAAGIQGIWGTGEPFDISPCIRLFASQINSPLFEKSAASMDLLAVARKNGRRAVEPIIKAAKANPAFASGLLRFYDPRDLMAAADSKEAAFLLDGDNGAADSMPAADQNGVTVIRSSNVGDLPEDAVSDSERDVLREDGILIRDHRTGTSKVYNLDLAQNLASPSEPGIYEILVKPGKYREMLVLTSPRTIGNGSTNGVATVVDLEAKTAVNALPASLIGRSALPNPDFASRVSGLGSISSVSVGKPYVAVNEDGEGSIPFLVMERKSEDGDTELMVSPMDGCRTYGSYGASALNPRECCESSYPDAYPRIKHTEDSIDLIPSEYDELREREDGRPKWYYRKHSARRIVVSDKIESPTTMGGTLMLPDSMKVIPLEKSELDLPHDPGTLLDVQSALLKTAGLHELDLFSNGESFQIQPDDREATGFMSKQAAVDHLMYDYGILYDTVAGMLKEARDNGRSSYLIKAAIGPWMEDGPDAPSPAMLDGMSGYDPGTQAQVVRGGELMQGVDGMAMGNRSDYDPNPQFDQPTLQASGRAGRSDQKAIFDTSTLAGLVKAMNTDDVIDQYLGDLTVGMDRIGRILFLFYWHNDRFQDRYGEEEMRELEDTLKNTFESTGDLVLFLKKKSIEPDMALQGSDVDLDETA